MMNVLLIKSGSENLKSVRTQEYLEFYLIKQNSKGEFPENFSLSLTIDTGI